VGSDMVIEGHGNSTSDRNGGKKGNGSFYDAKKYELIGLLWIIFVSIHSPSTSCWDLLPGHFIVTYCATRSLSTL